MVVHSCFRCGIDFQTESSRLCPRCKAPRRPKQLRGAIDLSGRPLSLREKQLVALVAEGMLNKEIAFALHLTEGTIKEYLNRIFQKTRTSNRTELAVWEVRRQLPPSNGLLAGERTA